MRASIPERIPENPEMSSLKSPMEEAFDQMYNDIESEGLQPVLNDYVYV